MSMFGSLGNLAGMMKDFQNMKQKAEQLKEELSKATFSSISSDGAVKVSVSGACEIISVTYLSVQPAPASVMEATNSALRQAKQEISKKISEVTGGIPLPGLF